jgi:hypothetical protein
MSLALIEETAKEARRLAIAGSPLAVGDFRIKKLVAPLEQAGAKVPVFAQVAKAISDLANGTEAESATRLLALSTLLNAILYTQGQSTTAAPFADLELFATNCSSTLTTARALKPLIAALTNSGAGRFEIIKSACERGALNDMRLIDPAIQALGDNYPEMADLVAEKILPAYGPGIVPRLKLGLDLKGKKSDARRLIVMHKVDPTGTLELCKVALEDGSAEVKAAAVECVGKHEEFLPLIMEQANAKNKIVRAAALEALAAHDRPEIVKLFGDLIKGNAFDLLARPFRAIRNAQVLRSMLDEGYRVLNLIANGDEEQIPRFWEILKCVENRSDAGEFLSNGFALSEKLMKVKAPKNSVFAGADIVVRITALLYRTGSPAAFQAILDKRDILPPAAFPNVLRSALFAWTPEKVFAEFSPLLAQNTSVAKDKTRQIQTVIWTGRHADEADFHFEDADESYTTDAQALKKIQWDPRWLDAAIKADQAIIVATIARPGHKASINYLLELFDSKKQIQTAMIVEALVRCEYPQTTDVLLDVIQKRTKGVSQFTYGLQMLFQSVRHLPPADLAKLDAFAAKLDEKLVDQYLEALAPLRAANPANQN